MKRCRWILAVVLAGAGATRGAEPNRPSLTPPEHRWALLISASEYEGLTPFPSRNEALGALREGLIQAGFPGAQVLLLNDAVKDRRLRPTKANLEAQLRWLKGEGRADELTPGQHTPLDVADEVWVAIALYGVRHHDAQYLCPIDGRLPEPLAGETLARSLLPIEAVRSALSSCKAGRKVLLGNVFRDDPRPASRGLLDAADLQAFDAARLRPARGYGELIGYDERHIEAHDVGGFLNQVLAGLKGQADYASPSPDRLVTLWELADYVQKRPGVMAKSVVVGDDFPLGRVQGEPPPPLTARYDVLMRLTSVLLQQQMHAPAIDASSRAVRSAPGDQAAAEAYARRANAHLGQADFSAALADANRADRPLVAIPDRPGNLLVGQERVGRVQPGQEVVITQAEGEFLGVSVSAAQGDVQGWLRKGSCAFRPVLPAPPAANPAAPAVKPPPAADKAPQ